ncbi:LamG-like jellyroll fold domain-containing protein [Thalassobellus suaedae]|uniref:LamG-like jellyroll fold domain-containing protein n=1 Tax=Thalassobellus suaedae TaxID=3074124 RepID=A0ABY9Y2D8_9FLAO|nr:LamG-like jellyroll fold domain-containing protein [Flavobacteriaceae bacterium HL-DH10]
MISKSNWIKISLKIIPIALSIGFLYNCKTSKKNPEQNDTTEWLIADILKTKSNSIHSNGLPKIVESPYGEAVQFNGIDDALFIKEMPLKSLKEFTIEMIFNPSLNAPFEQRVVHIGKVSDDRMLLEIRAIDNNWYFDGFVASGENKLALIDENLLHPLGAWYHVALVVSKNSLSTYVNGKLELTEPYTFNPIETGQSSVGVRLNKRSWFKGDIYKVKISPKQLKPKEFMSF